MWEKKSHQKGKLSNTTKKNPNEQKNDRYFHDNINDIDIITDREHMNSIQNDLVFVDNKLSPPLGCKKPR